MSIERRGFARLYVGVEAKYKIKDTDKEQTTVLVQDISLSGVRFISSESLKPGIELQFNLLIPEISIPVSAEGKVIWQKKFSESFFDTGIDFLSLDDQAKQDLSGYIGKSLGRVKENREFVRSNLSTMISFTVGKSNEEKRCISVDISPTGLKVFSKEKLQIDEEIQLSFTLPEEDHLINAVGKVIWAKEREEKFSEVGIEFVRIDDSDIQRINEYVKNTLGIEW